MERNDASGEVSGRSRPVRRLRVGVVATLLVVPLVVLLGRAPLPAYTVAPGPVISMSTAMTVDGVAVEEVLSGDFVVTTIALTDADVADLVRSWIDDDRRVVARSAFVDASVDQTAFVAEQQERFRASVTLAGAVAAELTGQEPVHVDVVDDRVGGPSGGLAAALAVVDVVSPEDLAAGRIVAATGEIRADGTVVAVGSVGDKVRSAALAGATLFLVPSAQLAEARAGAPADTPVQVVGVQTVADAVEVLSAR